MSRIRLATALMALAIFPSWAVAADDPDRCYTTSDPRCSGDNCGNTFYNAAVSQNWQQTRANANQGVMAQIAGVYYLQGNDPSGQMVNEAYRSYEASGLWQYRDRTCTIGSPIPCSQNWGAGQWAAYPLRDGTVFLMIHFSDLSRSNNCFSQTIRASRGGFTDSLGGSWQRVR